MKSSNRRSLLICILAFIVLIVLLSLPLYTFRSTLYSQKLGNTFVGDEKYLAAREKAEAALAGFEENGMHGLDISETVTERVNSKGNVTSMVTLFIEETVVRTGWQFMASGLPSGVELTVLLVCAALSLVLLTASVLKDSETDAAHLPPLQKRMRQTAGFLALFALLIVPVFVLTCNVTFLRHTELAADGFRDISGTLPLIDRFLYDGAGGSNTLSMADGMTLTPMLPLYLLLLPLCALLIGAVRIAGDPRHILTRGLLYAFVIVLCVVILYPYYVMLITAFRDNAESTDMNFLHLWPTKWNWHNLIDIIDRGVPRYLLNSIFLSFGATGIALLCGIPAAYAMARMHFRGKNAFLGFVIMSQMFAPVVLLVGIATLLRGLNLMDNLWGLIFINAAFNQAFAIWLLRGTFLAISPEMEQAACIDGCNTVTALLRVLLPMAMPGIVTTLIFVFINAWNEYTIATIIISTPLRRPITVGITQFSSFNMIEWQYLFMAALLATIPVVILFMFIEKHLVTGLTSGGVKG